MNSWRFFGCRVTCLLPSVLRDRGPASLACGLFGLVGVLASAEAAPLTVCIPDWNALPYVSDNPQRPGLVERLIIDSAREARIEVTVERLSPLRCLRAIERGTAQVAPLTMHSARLGIAQLPMRDGQFDASRRLLSIPLIVVRRSGDDRVQWDGRRFLPPGATVGVRHGLHVYRDLLEPHGIAADEGATTGEQLLRKLEAGRMDIALMSRGEFDILQTASPRRVEALPQLFAVVDYYLALSRHHSASQLKTVEAWWDVIARLRDKPEYAR